MGRQSLLLEEYRQRFSWQSVLVDRRWKANSIYFIVFGLSLNAAIKVPSTWFALSICAGNILMIWFSFKYDWSIRERLLLNMARLREVAQELELQDIPHYLGEGHTVLRSGGSSKWYYYILATCAVLWLFWILLMLSGIDLLSKV